MPRIAPSTRRNRVPPSHARSISSSPAEQAEARPRKGARSTTTTASAAIATGRRGSHTRARAAVSVVPERRLRDHNDSTMAAAAAASAGAVASVGAVRTSAMSDVDWSGVKVEGLKICCIGAGALLRRCSARVVQRLTALGCRVCGRPDDGDDCAQVPFGGGGCRGH